MGWGKSLPYPGRDEKHASNWVVMGGGGPPAPPRPGPPSNDRIGIAKEPSASCFLFLLFPSALSPSLFFSSLPNGLAIRFGTGGELVPNLGSSDISLQTAGPRPLFQLLMQKGQVWVHPCGCSSAPCGAEMQGLLPESPRTIYPSPSQELPGFPLHTVFSGLGVPEHVAS